MHVSDVYIAMDHKNDGKNQNYGNTRIKLHGPRNGVKDLLDISQKAASKKIISAVTLKIVGFDFFIVSL